MPGLYLQIVLVTIGAGLLLLLLAGRIKPYLLDRSGITRNFRVRERT